MMLCYTTRYDTLLYEHDYYSNTILDCIVVYNDIQQYDILWYDMIYYTMIQCNIILHGLVQCTTVQWYSIVQCTMYYIAMIHNIV